MGIHGRDYAQARYQSKAEVSTFSTRVYGWMSLGLAFTAFIAYFLFKTGVYVKLVPFSFIWIFAPFIIAMVIRGMINRLSFGAAAGLFLLYAGLKGIFLGTILPLYAMAYGGDIIWSAFATAALLFCSAMLYGMFTKSDLTTLKNILSFAIVGLIAVSILYIILSFFMDLGIMHLLISYLGLIIFVGLTATDAQQIRALSHQANDNSAASYKLALIMSMRMYINVIMIFLYLLSIFSSSKR